jgi:hypothetical protein
MKRYDLYGSTDLPLADAAGIVADALGVEFKPHDSMYRGGDYFRGRGPGIEVAILQGNFKDDEGYLAEPHFPRHRTLLYLTTEPEVALDEPEPPLAIPHFALLRSEWV